MTKMPAETTKTRVEDRLKIMVGEGLELSRKAQVAHSQAERVRLEYGTGQGGVTLEDVRAAEDAYRQATADEAAHAGGMAPMEDALKELERRGRESELLTLATATRAELDRVEGIALRRLEAAEGEAIRAAHAYREAKPEAERLRAGLRVQIWQLARVQGRLKDEDRMTVADRVNAQDALNQPWRAGEEHNPLTVRLVIGSSVNPANDTADHARRWGRTLDMLPPLED